MSTRAAKNTFSKQNSTTINNNNNNNNNVGNVKSQVKTQSNSIQNGKIANGKIASVGNSNDVPVISSNRYGKPKSSSKDGEEVNSTNQPKAKVKTKCKDSSKKNSSSVVNDDQKSGSVGNGPDGRGGKSIFRPFVILALPGVNLFRRFSTYRRLPQTEPAPKDRLEKELDRLTNKIDSLLDKLDDVQLEPPSCPEEQCILCAVNKATMQTFPCTHIAVCRTCFVKTIQSTVAEKKLPLRCVICRAKILRLKQHHKRSISGLQIHNSQSESISSGADITNGTSESSLKKQSSLYTTNNTHIESDGAVNQSHGSHSMRLPQPQLPNSASNYSINNNRLSASSSNQSFASGVSSVSSGSSINSASRSLRSFNLDSLSNFQNVSLNPHRSRITRTTSGGSFAGVSRRTSRSPSPAANGRPRSRSVDQNGSEVHLSANGPLIGITVNRTPSDDSLNSSSNRSSYSSSVGCSSVTMASPGSSSSPRSPVSPPWTNTNVSGTSRSPNGGVFFPQNNNTQTSPFCNQSTTLNAYSQSSNTDSSRGATPTGSLKCSTNLLGATRSPAPDTKNGNLSNGGAQIRNNGGKYRAQYNCNQYDDDSNSRYNNTHESVNSSSYGAAGHKGGYFSSASAANSNNGTGVSPGVPVHSSLGRASRLCTMLSPIKESRRENGSNQELRCSPERWSITSPSPTHSYTSEITSLIRASPNLTDDRHKFRRATLERYHIFYENKTSQSRSLRRPPINRMPRNVSVMPVNDPISNSSSPSKIPTSNYLSKNGVKSKPSSRIRCAEKILTQLEMHTDRMVANTNKNVTQNRKPYNSANITLNSSTYEPDCHQTSQLRSRTSFEKTEANRLNNNASNEDEANLCGYATSAEQSLLSNDYIASSTSIGDKITTSIPSQLKQKRYTRKTVTFKDP